MTKPSSSSMEEAKCLVWLKRGHALSPYLPPRWEEQAAPASGLVHEAGWMSWPPRSYSCSFCKREFRSAQALGGHMNVHRRDRALLKQIPTTEADNVSANQDHQDPFIKPLGSSQQAPPKVPSDDTVQTKLAMGLIFGPTGDNLKGAREGALGSNCEALSCKRHKSSSPTSPLKAASTIFLKQCGVLGSVEDLDLELRLGDPPKVN